MKWVTPEGLHALKNDLHRLPEFDIVPRSKAKVNEILFSRFGDISCPWLLHKGEYIDYDTIWRLYYTFEIFPSDHYVFFFFEKKKQEIQLRQDVSQRLELLKKDIDGYIFDIHAPEPDIDTIQKSLWVSIEQFLNIPDVFNKDLFLQELDTTIGSTTSRMKSHISSECIWFICDNEQQISEQQLRFFVRRLEGTGDSVEALLIWLLQKNGYEFAYELGGTLTAHDVTMANREKS